MDFTDPDPHPDHVAPGVIGLQTYGAEGHAGWVKFRSLFISDLVPVAGEQARERAK